LEVLLDNSAGAKGFKNTVGKYSEHILFWLAFYLFFVVNESKSEYGLVFVLFKQLIIVGFYALMVYVNLLYLIPRFLNKKSLLSYILALGFAAAVITPLKTLTFYLFYADNPVIQEIYMDRQREIFLSTLFIGIGSTLFKIISDWAFHQREKQELKKRTLESELNFLKSQINPHFLFNTLNNLYALTLKKSDRAPEIVLKLAEMMRYMLYECNERKVALSKEINYLKNYLDLEKIRQGSNVEIDFQLIGVVSLQRVAPLLFIPFVENCFKHGLKNEIGKGYVRLKMDVHPERINFHVANSKSTVLPSESSNRKSGGIGLINVKKRLELHYNSKYNLDIKDHPNEYIIDLQINLD
jgi:LytS/YehU family sensor histidine kinase